MSRLIMSISFLSFSLFAVSCTTAEGKGEDKGTVVKVGTLSATTPSDWKNEKPANRLRSYQLKLPGEKDHPDAEIAIYPEINPNPDKNFPKWKATFVPPDGKTIDDISKTGKWDVKGATVTFLDVTGTWKYRERPQDPTSKEMLLEDFRVVWVIVAEKEEASYIRLSGPTVSVDKQFKAFESWVKSLK
jgi:hypothetical protein